MSDKMSKPHYVRTDVSCLYCIFDEQGRRVRARPGCITRMKLAPPMIVESEEEKRRELAELRARVTALEAEVAERERNRIVTLKLNGNDVPVDVRQAFDAACAQIVALEGTVAALRERLELAQDILRDRCDHGHRCPKNEASQNLWATPDIIDAVPCECGLTAALETP